MTLTHEQKIAKTITRYKKAAKASSDPDTGKKHDALTNCELDGVIYRMENSGTEDKNKFFRLAKLLEADMPELKGVYGRHDYTNGHSTTADTYLENPNIDEDNLRLVFVKVDPLPEIYTEHVHNKWRRLVIYKQFMAEYNYEEYITPEACEQDFSGLNVATTPCRPKYLSADIAWMKIAGISNLNHTLSDVNTANSIQTGRTEFTPLPLDRQLVNQNLAGFLDKARTVDFKIHNQYPPQ